MSSVRDHEADLLRLLRRLEPLTPFAEAFAQDRVGRGVSLDPKALDVDTTPLVSGVAVRAWAGDRWVEGAASSFESSALRRLEEEIAGDLRRVAGHAAPPGPSSTTVGARETTVAHPMRDLDVDDEIARVKEMYRLAGGVEGVKFVDAAINWSDDERFYLNTAGANCYQRLTRVRAQVASIAVENGTSRIGFADSAGVGGQEIVDRFDEAQIHRCGTDAVAMLHAATPPAGEMNVILDPGTTATFAHESFGHGTEADQFVRQRSYLQPLLGQELGPSFLSIVDDGSLDGAWGSIYFDDEGNRSQRTVMIDHGRFVGALHDRDSAAALGARPTGNTRRSDFLSRAFVRMTNTSVEPGDRSFDELVEEARDGVILERWISGMEDPAGGQMQLKVLRGHRIEHGEVTSLLGSMALSGKVLAFLRDIRGIGRADQFRISAGFCGKGHGDYLPVGDGGSYLLSRALVGPA